jgi:hypothetical protein
MYLIIPLPATRITRQSVLPNHETFPETLKFQEGPLCEYLRCAPRRLLAFQLENVKVYGGRTLLEENLELRIKDGN